MTDPLTAFIVLALGIAMVIVVIGGGIWMCVRTADADHPPLTRSPQHDAAPATPLVTEAAPSAAAVPPPAPASTPLAS